MASNGQQPPHGEVNGALEVFLTHARSADRQHLEQRLPVEVLAARRLADDLDSIGNKVEAPASQWQALLACTAAIRAGIRWDTQPTRTVPTDADMAAVAEQQRQAARAAQQRPAADSTLTYPNKRATT